MYFARHSNTWRNPTASNPEYRSDCSPPRITGFPASACCGRYARLTQTSTGRDRQPFRVQLQDGLPPDVHGGIDVPVMLPATRAATDASRAPSRVHAHGSR